MSYLIRDQGVTTSKYANSSIPNTAYGSASISVDKLASMPVGSSLGHISVDTGGASTLISVTNSTPTTVLSVTLTSAGRPIFIQVMDSGAGGSYFGFVTSTNSVTGRVRILKNGSTVIQDTVIGPPVVAATTGGFYYPTSSVSILDYNASAGSNTYALQMWVPPDFGTGTVYLSNSLFTAYEI